MRKILVVSILQVKSRKTRFAVLDHLNQCVAICVHVEHLAFQAYVHAIFHRKQAPIRRELLLAE